MCEQWLNDFAAFYADMGPCPPGCTLDRINNDGNYEPGNCRWADAKTQSWNNRNCRYVEWRGQKLPLAEVARIAGIDYKLLHGRIRRGEPLETAVRLRSR